MTPQEQGREPVWSQHREAALDDDAPRPVILYLDVDGVVCPFKSGPGSWGDADDSTGSNVSLLMGAALAALDCSITWATTWQEAANNFLCPTLNWAPKPVLQRKPEFLWWKLDQIANTHPAGHPFVWADDELANQTHALDGMLQETLDALAVPYLLISPNSQEGLTQAEITLVAEFINSTKTASLW